MLWNTSPDDRLPRGAIERPGVAYLLVLAASLVLYVGTCAPGILWVDSGIFQYRILVDNVEDERGLALSHPLYIYVGMFLKSLPIGDLAHKINLISAVAAAATIANLFLLVRLWLGALRPALLSAVTLALSWTFWAHSTIAEVYTLSSALFTAELLFLLLYLRTRSLRHLGWLFFLNGLEFSNHVLAVIPLTVYLGFLVSDVARRQVRTRALILAFAAFVIGSLPYLTIIAGHLARKGDVSETLYSVFFGSPVWRPSVLNTSITPRIAVENLLFFAYSFPTPNVLLLVPGVVAMWKSGRERAFDWAVAALSVLFLLFAFRYTVPDRYVFFIPFHVMSAVVLGAGFQWFGHRFPGRVATFVVAAFTLLPIPVYYAAPLFAGKMAVPMSTKRDLPYRDQYKWFLSPWKTGYTGTQRFADEVLAEVDPNAVVFGDASTVFALLLTRDTEGVRPDVTIISWNKLANNDREYSSAEVEAYIRQRPFYVVSPLPGYCPEHILNDYDFEKAGHLWKVKLPARGGGATAEPAP